MDLTYGPGELDHKISKKHDGSDMKREHDSVDDFEHLDHDISPVEAIRKEFSSVEKLDEGTKHVDPHESAPDDKGIFDAPSNVESSNDNHDSAGGTEIYTSNLASNNDFPSEFEIQNKGNTHSINKEAEVTNLTNLMDFGMGGDPSPVKLDENIEESTGFLNENFISAEKAEKLLETDKESDYYVGSSSSNGFKNLDGKADELGYKGRESIFEDTFDTKNTKSMKEADALEQYNLKSANKEDSDGKEALQPELDYDSHPFSSDKFGLDLKNFVAICPAKSDDQIEPNETLSNDNLLNPEQPSADKRTPTTCVELSLSDSLKDQFQEEGEDKNQHKDLGITDPLVDATSNSTSTFGISTSTYDPNLDDIIGPEDVFKRIGLDAWFTPDRLHPTVEALVYWRDPKQSGVVFGSIMAILLSLCYMSLISVVAYSSLLALSAAICFRIYKSILQAVQKTSDGHPFKDYLDLDMSLPQEKVRETADTAVVHINAAIVELRRLFLVEDLIDSIKFAVCLWCLTYVGAIFNGMTLVILAFVALFSVPKIYENNKTSIDQYIDLGRSKVAEITSKVKAALPVGKKEPEKDKEQ